MRLPSRSVNRSFLTNRLLLVWLLLMLAAVGLLVKLFTVQILDGDELHRKAQVTQQTIQRPFVPRRMIVDRQGNVVAADQPSYTIFAHPKMFRTLIVEKGNKNKGKLRTVSATEMAELLSPILKISAPQLVAKFQEKEGGILLGKRFGQEVFDQISALKNDGLDIRQTIKDYRRVYPQNEMAAEVLGFVDLNNYKAQAGVELSQEKLLEREMREFYLTRTGSADGGILPDNVKEDFLHHDDLQLQLTIDLRLQRVARNALKTQLAKWKAKRGAVIVMDAETGAIRAMVIEPTFDPNNYTSYPRDRYVKNWVVTDLYEPGSTFKPLNVAIALENKIITPETRFNDTGLVKIGKHQIRNSDKKSHGLINAAQVLQYSSNIGMVEMMQKLSPAIYHNWLERLGLGQKVGIDLPSEVRGTMKDRNTFLSSPIEPATASFGQGLSLTPIQLVTMTGALANGGKLLTPYLVEGLFDSNGQRQDAPKRPAPRQIFTEKNSEAVLKMMQSVVESGTGSLAQVKGFAVAGKTGTAQKASNQGGYQVGAKITSFVSVLPVDSPHRYVVFAAVDEPQGEKTAGGRGEAFGSTVAAPIVKEVMDTLIVQEEIIPINGQVISSPSPTTTPSTSPTLPPAVAKPTISASPTPTVLKAVPTPNNHGDGKGKKN
jgi:cell division protein FtsI (penicillin-binding protein 3)